MNNSSCPASQSVAARSNRAGAWFHKYCCVYEVTQLCLTPPSYLCPPFSSALTCCRYKTLLAMATWPNNSQQWRETEVSAACQTKLRVSSVESALHQACAAGSFLFTPENKFSLFTPVVVFWKTARALRCKVSRYAEHLIPSSVLMNPKVNVPKEPSATRAQLL